MRTDMNHTRRELTEDELNQVSGGNFLILCIRNLLHLYQGAAEKKEKNHSAQKKETP